MGNNSFAQEFSFVPGRSDRRNLPILDIIRLGVRLEGSGRPKEVDYFVLPKSSYGQEIEKKFGDKPKELEVWFPSNDLQIIFPQSYKLWGSSKGMKCRGDGENKAVEKIEGTKEWKPKETPCKDCPKKDTECKCSGYLSFMIPKVSAGGIFQIRTTSFHSTVDVSSGLDFCRLLIGRFSMIPFKLSRFPKETHGSGRKEIHYCLKAEHLIPAEQIPEFKKDTERILLATKDLYQLEPPKEENPVMDEGATIVQEEDDIPESVTGPIDETPPENDSTGREMFEELSKEEMLTHLKAKLSEIGYEGITLKKPLTTARKKEELLEIYEQIEKAA